MATLQIQTPSLFSFDSYREFLAQQARTLSPKGQGSRLQRWSSLLGYKSARSFAMVLKGQRYPSQQMVDALARYLKMSAEEQKYFQLLIAFEKKKKAGESIELLAEEMKKLRPELPRSVSLSTDIFNYIAEWHHVVIRQYLTAQPGRLNPEKVSALLAGKVTPAQVRQAVDTMLNLRMIEWDGSAKKYKILVENFKTGDSIPSEAIQTHHRHMMARASEALSEQSVEERECASVTFRFDRDRMKEAKRRIREFRDRFNRDFSSSISSEIFQLNLQFFSHTKSTKERK